MRIINQSPGILSIPPKNWGAIEKLIWEIHKVFEARGHESIITDNIASVYRPGDIVISHMHNQALQLAAQNIPYRFWMNDHHVVLGGKQSYCYKSNSEAIDKSVKSWVSAKYLVPYFDSSKVSYLRLGVNSSIYQPVPTITKQRRLLCVGNTGNSFDIYHDRKGFGQAIQVARALNWPITVAGPTDFNKRFFDSHKIIDVDLKLVYDLNEEDLVKLYSEHRIFLHPSDLEGGHPNLTILESLACGVPVVGTGFEELAGMQIVNNDLVSLMAGVIHVDKNYDLFRTAALKTAKEWSWNRTADDMLNSFERKNIIISSKLDLPSRPMKDVLIDAYENTEINPKESRVTAPRFQISFILGPKVEIFGGPSDAKYRVEFIDTKDNSIQYADTIGPNCWTKASRAYYTNWLVNIRDSNNNLIYQHKFDPKGTRVLINMESKALGDTIAWFSYLEEFRKKHNCKVVASTFWNELFETEYPEMEFVNPGSEVNDLYAQYHIGWFFKDDNPNGFEHPQDFRSLPLQQTASDILGLSFKVIKPRIYRKIKAGDKTRNVGIAMHSTMQNRYWNHPTGWQELTDWLNKSGYNVLVLSKEEDGYMGNYYPKGISRLSNYDIHNVIYELSRCSFFVGILSGLVWLSWALDVPTFSIESATYEDIELNANVYKILPNEDICQRCIARHKLNQGKWDWCPDHQNDNRKFECSKTISPEYVIKLISSVIDEKSKSRKIQIIHMRTEPYAPREMQSKDSLKQLKEFGIDYKEMLNPIATHIPENVKKFCRRPEAISSVSGNKVMVITPAHYGCYLAHAGALKAIDEDNYDYSILCECDAILSVSPEEFYDALMRVIDRIENDNSIHYVNLGYEKKHGIPEEDVEVDDMLTDSWYQIPAHCYLIPNNKKNWYLDRIEDTPWDSGDMWYNHMFFKKRGMRMRTNEVYSIQAQGKSLLDGITK